MNKTILVKLFIISISLFLASGLFAQVDTEKKDVPPAAEEKKDDAAIAEEKKEKKEEAIAGDDADRFYPDLEEDEDLKGGLAEKTFSPGEIQFGGWLNPVFIYQDDNVSSSASSITTAKLWAKS